MAAAGFQPAWWCRGAHLQTLWPRLFRRGPVLPLRRERLELPDGDFVDLDWTPGNDGPIVVLFHGLEGSARSPYARGMLAAVHRRGWRGVVMHFRGCSGEPNRLARSYHSGDTGDIAFFIKTLRRREPGAALAAVGYSLGGNALLKWLGEAADAGLRAAAAVSVPFLLHRAADRLDRGFSRLYQWKLLGDLRRGVRRKFQGREGPVDSSELKKLRRFWDFDERVTAPLHGFAGAHHYYSTSSCRPYLKSIQVPTLIIQAYNDPFMTPDVIPAPEELASAVALEVHTHGGHVGFVAGPWPWQVEYWLERRIPDYLAPFLAAQSPMPR